MFNRSVAERFDMSKSTLSNTFFRIINVIKSMAPMIITWPTVNKMIEIENKFYNGRNLKKIIGVVDGTYCPIKAPKSQSHSYTNRKKFHSITLQGICDHKMRFIDCSVGYPSSVHDKRVFTNSAIFKNAEIERRNEYFPNERKILGDKAYPILPWCIPPYFDRGRLTDQQRKFNKTHASMRQIVERTYALLFGRFRRLHFLDMNSVKYMPSTILACCVLHNICLQFPEDEEHMQRIFNDGISRARLSATDYRRSNDARNR